MSKIAIFAAAQVALYFAFAFVAWDLAWVVSLGEQTADIRVMLILFWFGLSVAAWVSVEPLND